LPACIRAGKHHQAKVRHGGNRLQVPVAEVLHTRGLSRHDAGLVDQKLVAVRCSIDDAAGADGGVPRNIHHNDALSQFLGQNRLKTSRNDVRDAASAERHNKRYWPGWPVRLCVCSRRDCDRQGQRRSENFHRRNLQTIYWTTSMPMPITQVNLSSDSITWRNGVVLQADGSLPRRHDLRKSYWSSRQASGDATRYQQTAAVAGRAPSRSAVSSGGGTGSTDRC